MDNLISDYIRKNNGINMIIWPSLLFNLRILKKYEEKRKNEFDIILYFILKKSLRIIKFKQIYIKINYRYNSK